MGKARVDLERCLLQYLRGHETRSADRHNLIVVAMHHQNRYVDLLQVFSEVGLREGLDAVVMGLDPSRHALQPPILADAFRNFGARAVVSVKRKGEILVELRSICGDSGSAAVED